MTKEEFVNLFDEKVDEIPVFTRDATRLSAFSDVWNEVSAKHKLGDKSFIFDTIVWRALWHDVSLASLESTLAQELTIAPEQAKDIARDTIGMLFVPLLSDYPEAEGVFISLGGDVAKAVEESALMGAILDMVNERLKKTALSVSESFDPVAEQSALVNIFQNSLLHILHLENDKLKEDLNTNAIFLLRTVDGLPEALLKDIMANQERVGGSPIVVEGHATAPTIENWLHDFIAVTGIDNITGITIAQYLASSPNARLLADGDKGILQQLFEIFRILKNFPDSLSRVPLDQWMIIPYHLSEGPIGSILPTSIPADTPSTISTQVNTSIETVSAQSVPVAAIPVPVPSMSMLVVPPIVAKPSVPATPSAPTAPEMSAMPPSSASVSMDRYQSYADIVIERAGVFFGNEQIKKRVRGSIVTRLKDVRDPYELKAILVQAIDAGGAGLSEVQADVVVREANSVHDDLRDGRVPAVAPVGEKETPPFEVTVKSVEIPSEPSIAPPEPVVQTLPVPEPKKPSLPIDLPLVPMRPKKMEKQANAPRLTIEEVDGVPTIVKKEADVVEKKVVEAPVLEPAPGIPVAPTIPEEPVATPVALTPKESSVLLASDDAMGTSIPVVNRKTTTSLYKVSFSDVKASPRLVDPVEELRILTLTDFRRLHSDPFEAIKKIYQKIQLLEKDSFVKRQAGVQAWSENEISRLYHEIGTEIFTNGVASDQVIATRTAAGLPVLTERELDALMELNEMLRF